jgi:hypothetical protein
MRKSLVVLGILALLLAGVAVAIGPRRLIADLRWGKFTPGARMFLEAAARHDSLALTQLASNAGAVRRGLALGRMSNNPASISARSIRPIWGGRIADTVVVQFHTAAPLCSPYGGEDEIQFHFVPELGGWRISKIGGSGC